MVIRVAMITPWMRKCGIYTYSRDLIEGLVNHDIEVYVIRLPRFGFKTIEILRKVVYSIPLDKIDVIHCQNEYGLYWGEVSRLGVYTNLVGEFYQELNRIDKPLVTTMHAAGNIHWDGVIRRISDKVIVHNKYCAELFRYPSTIIAHGAKPTKTPSIDKAKNILHIRTSPIKGQSLPIVGYCGFISNYKGLEILIDAMVDVPSAALLLAGGYHAGGDTSYIQNLKRKSLELLQTRCRWLGWVPEERLSTVYGAMDLLVYPSLRATESGALITALSHGKAVIASDIPPFIEKAKVGALMTFNDKNDLTSKINRVIEDDELRKKLEDGAKRYCEATSWDVVAREHIDLYKNVLES